MLPAETACLSKSAATVHLAHFRVATAVFRTPSPCNNSCCAPFPRADKMLLAKTMAANTYITTFNSANSLCAMLRAEPFSNSIAVTTCIRALHFAGMMETNPFAIVCVPEARMHCADAEGAVLLADPLS